MYEQELVDELKSFTVLYVEDEESVRSTLSSIIKRRVKNLIIAENGVEGYKNFLESSPDLIITDIKMPFMDGLEMSAKIREHSKTVPIIITSAFNDANFLIDAIDKGINQFVLKPIESRKLFNAIFKCVKEVSTEKKLKHANEQLLKNLTILTSYKDAIEAGSIISITDPDGKITFVNQAFCDITGYTKDEVIGKTHKIIKCDEEGEYTERKKIKEFKKRKEIFKGLIKNKRKDGDYFYVNTTIAPIMDQNKNVIEFLETRNDVTQLIKQIYTDPLTGYQNRAALSKDVKTLQELCVIIINLDSFKDVNDFYGSSEGDKILIEMTKRLDHYITNNLQHTRLYKLSSDEFGILIDAKVDNPKEIVRDIEKFIKKQDFLVKGNTINLSATIGYSTTKENIFSNADMALRYAKNNDIDFVSFEEVSFVEKEYESNLIWSKKLKKALAQNNIVAFFQPIINNETGKVVKYESLVRIIDDGKVISPFYFLEIAKKMRLYPKLTKIMIEKAFKTFQNTEYEFSINFSAMDIDNNDTKEFLFEKIKEYDVASRLVIEILESENFDNYDNIKLFIDKLKSLGCKVAIDDFGSGYSNFKHLIMLDVDFIKIDGSLIKEIADDKNSKAVASTIVSFAKKLNMKTIAEYVHSQEVYDVVKEIGVSFSQGYFLGEPAKEILKGKQ